ncbi:MAG: hypothetical protein ACJ74J_08055 [Blastocatellia bacterium]
MKRITILALVTILLTLGIFVMQTARAQRADDTGAGRDQWEYLVVAGPQSTNFTASGNSGMRKEPSGGFNREDYVTEQQMDKLGVKGWELVSVAAAPSGAIYYFKRHK